MTLSSILSTLKSTINLFLRNYLLKPVGFFEKQATMREFVILLVLLLGGYVSSHMFIPSNSSLSLSRIKSDKIRSPILQEIGLMKDELKNKENTLRSQLNQTPIAKEPTASPSTGTLSNSEKSLSSLKVSNENSSLTLKKLDEWKENLTKTSISQKQEQYLASLSSDLSSLLKQLESKDSKDSKGENLSAIFLNLNKNLANLESTFANPIEQDLFWNGNGKWLEVVLWSLFGTLLYIIQQTADYHLSASDKKDDGDKKDVQRKKGVEVLVRRKPQYYYFLIQSPFTALVILWILSMANLNIAGIALALSSAPSEVLISLSFILGLYNRVANTQLNMIVANIFGNAWKQTVRKIEIKIRDDENSENDSPKTINIAAVSCGECVNFDVLPDVKVKWTIVSKPSAGIIDKSTGTYIAPLKGFYYDADAELKRVPSYNSHNYKQDIIRAEREDEKDVSALLLVKLTDQVDPPIAGAVTTPAQSSTEKTSDDGQTDAASEINAQSSTEKSSDDGQTGDASEIKTIE